MDTSDDAITIMDAARLLHMTYQQVHNLVARGAINAEQDRNGHWRLSTRSVANYSQHSGSAPAGMTVEEHAKATRITGDER